MVLLVVNQTPGEELPAAQPNPGQIETPLAGRMPATNENGGRAGAWLDASHQFLSHGVIGAVDRFDRLFGDDRVDDELPRSCVFVRWGIQQSRFEDWTVQGSFRARLVLPRLRERLHLVLDDSAAVEEPGSGEDLSDAVEESQLDAALRWLVTANARQWLSVDAGARGVDPLQGFGRMRGRVTVPFARWEMRLSQQLAWFTRDGWTETTGLQWTRPWADDWWFRCRSQVTWEEKNSGVTPRQVFQVGHEVSKHRAYRFELAGAWPATPHTSQARYSAAVLYRQRLLRQWLFWEVEPGVDFRQEWRYRPNPGLTVRLEIAVGDYP